MHSFLRLHYATERTSRPREQSKGFIFVIPVPDVEYAHERKPGQGMIKILMTYGRENKPDLLLVVKVCLDVFFPIVRRNLSVAE